MPSISSTRVTSFIGPIRANYTNFDDCQDYIFQRKCVLRSYIAERIIWGIFYELPKRNTFEVYVQQAARLLITVDLEAGETPARKLMARAVANRALTDESARDWIGANVES